MSARSKLTTVTKKSAKSKKPTSTVLFQLKITLKSSKPPIWRRVLVGDQTPLPLLHLIIQSAMGWDNAHLHQFIVDSISYGEPSDEDWDEMEDESLYTIANFLTAAKQSIRYEYDFGDGWEHQIVLEKILPLDPALTVPCCLEGKRACPPEDCGGIPGYESLLEILADPEDSEYESMLEWLGGDFDPEEFDLEEINKRIRFFVPAS